MTAIRDYWNRQPCNVRHSSALYGSQRWSEEVTERKYFVEPHIKPFAEFPKWKDLHVLEIGCGIGSDTLEFAKAGANVWAVDISSMSVALARKRLFPKYYATFTVLDAEQILPHLGMGFDLVYAFGVLHHTPNPDAILRNARKAMKDSGELRIMLYAKWSLKYFLGERPEAQSGCPMVKFYSGREAKQLLERNGFKILSMRKTHIFPWKIADYTKHRYVKRWYWRFVPASLFRFLETLLGHHLLIVAVKA